MKIMESEKEERKVVKEAAKLREVGKVVSQRSVLEWFEN